MDNIATTIQSYWQTGRKTHTTPSGWVSGNAVCCVNNGHSKDTRGRGGLKVNADSSFTYSCFNCGFKTSWKPGRTVSPKLRTFMQWLHIPDTTISKLALAALQSKQDTQDDEPSYVMNLKSVNLPPSAKLISSYGSIKPQKLKDVLGYMKTRSLSTEDYNFYWSSDSKFNDRFIIPYYHNRQLVGWTARTINKNKKTRYISDSQRGYVFGLDFQHYERKYAIVCEGVLDAIYIQGISLMGSNINDLQSSQINALNKQVIVVPDRDKDGQKLVDAALKYNWTVSFPQWESDIKDIGDAVLHYGKLYTLYSILTSVYNTRVKIELQRKWWFNN